MNSDPSMNSRLDPIMNRRACYCKLLKFGRRLHVDYTPSLFHARKILLRTTTPEVLAISSGAGYTQVVHLLISIALFESTDNETQVSSPSADQARVLGNFPRDCFVSLQVLPLVVHLAHVTHYFLIEDVRIPQKCNSLCSDTRGGYSQCSMFLSGPSLDPWSKKARRIHMRPLWALKLL